MSFDPASTGGVHTPRTAVVFDVDGMLALGVARQDDAMLLERAVDVAPGGRGPGR